jgi:hypothetical protein
MTTTTGKTIIPFGAKLQPHEIETAEFFNKLGIDIEFLARNYDKGVRTPDIKMNGVLWEIKAPIGNGKYTIIHAFKKATHQSENIIFDLRRSKMRQLKAVSQLQKQFDFIRKIKRLLIITKHGQILDFKK